MGMRLRATAHADAGLAGPFAADDEGRAAVRHRAAIQQFQGQRHRLRGHHVGDRDRIVELRAGMGHARGRASAPRIQRGRPRRRRTRACSARRRGRNRLGIVGPSGTSVIGDGRPAPAPGSRRRGSVRSAGSRPPRPAHALPHRTRPDDAPAWSWRGRWRRRPARRGHRWANAEMLGEHGRQHDGGETVE